MKCTVSPRMSMLFLLGALAPTPRSAIAGTPPQVTRVEAVVGASVASTFDVAELANIRSDVETFRITFSEPVTCRHVNDDRIELKEAPGEVITGTNASVRCATGSCPSATDPCGAALIELDPGFALTETFRYRLSLSSESFRARPTVCPPCSGNPRILEWLQDLEGDPLVANEELDAYPSTCDGDLDTFWRARFTAVAPPPMPPVCGDGECEAGENASSCFDDCHCGNGICDTAAGEDATTCPDDCLCGNGDGDPGESNSSCPADCPPLPSACTPTTPPVGGNNACWLTDRDELVVDVTIGNERSTFVTFHNAGTTTWAEPNGNLRNVKPDTDPEFRYYSYDVEGPGGSTAPGSQDSYRITFRTNCARDVLPCDQPSDVFGVTCGKEILTRWRMRHILTPFGEEARVRLRIHRPHDVRWGGTGVDWDCDGLPDSDAASFEERVLDELFPQILVSANDGDGLFARFPPGATIGDNTGEVRDGTVYGEVFPNHGGDGGCNLTCVEAHWHQLWKNDTPCTGHDWDREAFRALVCTDN